MLKKKKKEHVNTDTTRADRENLFNKRKAYSLDDSVGSGEI